MAGTITIKDSTATKFQIVVVSNVRHAYAVTLNKWDSPGDALPPVDHDKTVGHSIMIDFELTNRGTYDGGETLGTTGDIWKQKSLLAGLKVQASTDDYYTLIEDDDTIETSGYTGLFEQIVFDRAQPSQSKMTGQLVFIETDDVFNF